MPRCAALATVGRQPLPHAATERPPCRTSRCLPAAAPIARCRRLPASATTYWPRAVVAAVSARAVLPPTARRPSVMPPWPFPAMSFAGRLSHIVFPVFSSARPCRVASLSQFRDRPRPPVSWTSSGPPAWSWTTVGRLNEPLTHEARLLLSYPLVLSALRRQHVIME